MLCGHLNRIQVNPLLKATVLERKSMEANHKQKEQI